MAMAVAMGLNLKKLRWTVFTMCDSLKYLTVDRRMNIAIYLRYQALKKSTSIPTHDVKSTYA